MSPELDEELCFKYPDIFCNRHGDRKSTLMNFGFECDDGWFNLIDRLCAVIKNHVENENRKGNELEVIAFQVKSKFGGLRFYLDTHSDYYIEGAISLAETMSLTICEYCGSPGTTGGKGWIYTLCEPCRIENERKRKDSHRND